MAMNTNGPGNKVLKETTKTAPPIKAFSNKAITDVKTTELSNAVAIISRHAERLDALLEWNIVMSGVVWRGDERKLARILEKPAVLEADILTAIAKVQTVPKSKWVLLYEGLRVDLERLAQMSDYPAVRESAKKALKEKQ